VEQYVRTGYKKVGGWMRPESARLIECVSRAQVGAGVTGAVGEIGVHHGRLFLLLYLLRQPEERAFAVDIFDAQHLNVDHSGKGDRAIFERHLRRIRADFSVIDIFAESSVDMTPERLRCHVGYVRLFSIDGGHTTDIALNDLRLAEASLVDGGVVVLDDAFQPLFPGVAAAVARYLLGDGELVPFAISGEKVLLTQPGHHDGMLAAAQSGMGDLVVATMAYFGHDVAVIGSAPSLLARLHRGVAGLDQYQRLRRAPLLGPVIERLRPAVLKVMRR